MHILATRWSILTVCICLFWAYRVFLGAFWLFFWGVSL